MIENTWPPYLRWLQRAIYPHGVRCIWRCSPWHQPGNYPPYEEPSR